MSSGTLLSAAVAAYKMHEEMENKQHADSNPAPSHEAETSEPLEEID